MSILEIRHRTGMIETRELSKDSPLLIGQLPSSDIRIVDEGVAPVHCRISWNKRQFEVAAASPLGVQFNGTTVRQRVLAPGDVIRVGAVDIVLLAEARKPGAAAYDFRPPPAAPAAAPQTGVGQLIDSEIELAPLTEESL